LEKDSSLDFGHEQRRNKTFKSSYLKIRKHLSLNKAPQPIMNCVGGEDVDYGLCAVEEGEYGEKTDHNHFWDLVEEGKHKKVSNGHNGHPRRSCNYCFGN